MALAATLFSPLRKVARAAVVCLVGVTLGCAGPPEVPDGVLDGSMPESESGLRALLERDPTNLDAWANLWWMVQQKGETAQLDVARECLARNPGKADAHALLGAHYDGFGRWVDAEIVFRKALRIDPASQAALSLCSLLRRFHLTAESVQVATAALGALTANAAPEPDPAPDASKGAPTALHRLSNADLMSALVVELWLSGAESEAARWAAALPADNFYRWAFTTLGSQRASQWAGPISVPDWVVRIPAVSESRSVQDQRVEAYWLLALLAITYQRGGELESSPPSLAILEEGLKQHDDPRIREACLFGSLAAAWLRVGLDQRVESLKRMDVLERRLRLLAGPRTSGLVDLARQIRADVDSDGSPTSWTGVLPASSNDELVLRVQAIPSSTLLSSALGLSVRNAYGIQWRNHPFVDALSVALLAKVKSPELAVAVAQSRYGLKDWAGVGAAAKLALKWLNEDHASATSPAKDAPERGHSAPSRAEFLTAVARELDHEARCYGGDREAVVRELRAFDNDVRSRPWLLVVDEYWKERERRGLPPPIPTLLPDGMRNG